MATTQSTTVSGNLFYDEAFCQLNLVGKAFKVMPFVIEYRESHALTHFCVHHDSLRCEKKPMDLQLEMTYCKEIDRLECRSKESGALLFWANGLGPSSQTTFVYTQTNVLLWTIEDNQVIKSGANSKEILNICVTVSASNYCNIHIVKESSLLYILFRHKLGPSIKVLQQKEDTHSERAMALVLAVKLSYSFYGILEQVLPVGQLPLEDPKTISVPKMTSEIFDHVLSTAYKINLKIGQFVKGLPGSYIYALDTNGKILFTFELHVETPKGVIMIKDNHEEILCVGEGVDMHQPTIMKQKLRNIGFIEPSVSGKKFQTENKRDTQILDSKRNLVMYAKHRRLEGTNKYVRYRAAGECEIFATNNSKFAGTALSWDVLEVQFSRDTSQSIDQKILVLILAAKMMNLFFRTVYKERHWAPMVGYLKT